MPIKSIIYAAWLATILLLKLSPASAVIVTHDSGVEEPGRVGEITDSGFQFFGERFTFIDFKNVADIQPDNSQPDKQQEQEADTIRQISLLLKKDTGKIKRLKRQLRQWLRDGDFDKLEQKADDLNRSRARWSSGKWQIRSFYFAFTNDISSGDIADFNKRVGEIEKWREAKHDSSTANIALMTSLIDLAWAHRGSGYSKTVSEAGLKRFREYLKKALDIGNDMIDAGSKDPMLYYLLIRAGNGYGLDKEHLKQLARLSVESDREFQHSHNNILYALLPKWGGSRSEVEDFSQWLYQLNQEAGSAEVIYLTHRWLQGVIKESDYPSYDFDGYSGPIRSLILEHSDHLIWF